MNGRRPLLPVAFLVASVLVLAACFGSSSGPPAPVAVAFVSALPASVTVGGSFQVAAALANDSSTKGINWTCNPSTAGTFTPTNTASGVATTFMATSEPAGQSVTIIATSAADSTKFASGNVTVNAGSVTFDAPAPPPTLTINGGGGVSVAQVSATITSAVAAAVMDGVDWTASCSVAGGCGSFSSNHTNSGVSTTYTAPNSTPAGALAVTIKAASTFDSSDSVSAVITVSSTTPAAFLCASCTYTFTAAGEDVVQTASGAEASPYGIVGQFTADGMGSITGGEQDFSDLALSTVNTPDTITSGSYSFTPDGRGTIILNSVDRGPETLGVVLVSANHMLVTEFDTLATASGSMDLQTASQATLNGGYAYVAGGSDLLDGGPLAFGGVFNVTGAGVISSSTGVCDANFEGKVSTQQGYSSGSGYTGPDTFGRIQISLRPNFIGNLNIQGVTGPVVLAAYINDAAHLKFVEVDPNFGVTAGVAVGQTGSLTSLPANSSYVFTTFGTSAVGPYNFVADLTSDGTSKLQDPNGASSPNSDVNNAGVPSTGSITGTYSVGASGRVAVALEGVPLDSITGNGTTATNFAMYLTGGSDPAMTLELDNVGITTGSAYTRTASTFTLSSISGPYGLNYTLFDPTGATEFDATGQLLADGQGNLLGLQDVNASFAPAQAQASSGSYASNSTSRFTGTLTSTPTGALGFSYYVVSPTQVVIIETDANAVTLGVFQLQTPPF